MKSSETRTRQERAGGCEQLQRICRLLFATHTERGWGRVGMLINNEQLRLYFRELSRKRGTEDYFHRFESATCYSSGLVLHLDVIEKDQNRPTVVFMPGTNAYALLYGEFLAALADRGYNVVGFDPRGHGRSGGARGSYTIPELMADMHTAVLYARDRFGDPIVVAGSSQGGITAFYYAAAGNPIAGVVCHNLADLGAPESLRLTRNPALSRRLKPLIKTVARLIPELKIPLTCYLDLKAEPVRGMGSAKTVLYEDPLTVSFIRLKGMASLAEARMPCPVEEITTPVYVLHGARDTIFPQDYIEEIFHRLRCKKTLRVYKDLPHYLIVDHIESILPDIAEWLEDLFT